MFALAVPFILSLSFLGQFVGAWFQRRETAVLLLIAFSMPLFFMVGVSWPLEAAPEVLRIFSGIFPSTAGIDGLVRLNQMGATLADVSKDWRHLWLLAGVYFGLIVLSARLATADGRRIEARVTELRPLGEFPVWRAARAVGDHDLNSFRLRLDPNGESTRLEPGMSVWLPGA